MLVGSLTNPALPLEDELRRIADAGFDFVDLALEPPGAWPCDAGRIGRLLEELALAAVGHTAYYLPIASPFAELREQARRLFERFCETFASLGVRMVNVHPDPMTPLVPLADVRLRNAEAVAALADDADKRGVKLMVENLGRSFSTADDLRPILDASDGVGFHLDVGHAHMGRGRGEPNRTAGLLEEFGNRLAHVHVHDNFGVDDLHLPLGTGTVDWAGVVGALKEADWDGTVTLEVFTPQREYLDVSRRLWLEWWATPAR